MDVFFVVYGIFFSANPLFLKESFSENRKDEDDAN